MGAVTRVDGGHRLVGESSLVEFANRWLGHLEGRQFSLATVLSYAFDAVCLARLPAARASRAPHEQLVLAKQDRSQQGP